QDTYGPTPPAFDEEDLLAFIEGRLDAAAAARVRRWIDSSDDSRRQYDWVKGIYEELHALGNAAVADAPGVDLVDDVMAAVNGAGFGEAPPRHRRASVRRLRWLWVGAAAAAAVLIALGILWQWGPSEQPGAPVPTQARVPQAPAGPVEPAAPAGDEVRLAQHEAFEPLKVRFQESKKRLQDLDAERPAKAVFESTVPPDLSSLSIDDIIAARKSAGSDGTEWARLRQWATLTPETAAALAASPDTTPAVALGAAQGLPAEAAEELLFTVVGHLPDDPYVRFALARAEASQAEPPADALSEVDRLRSLDPDNALSYYLEAKLLLDAGDTEGALAALALAAELDEASAYSLESARYREQALVESGLAPESAHVLTALTAGMDEYNFLCDLSDDLLEYGQEYWEMGDVQAAQQIFEAVQQMGEQIEQGAALAQELLAALDIQRAAVDVLEGLYTALESVTGIEALTADTIDLVSGLEEIGSFFAALDELLFGTGDTSLWTMISDVILQEGDLTLFDYLEQLGLDVLLWPAGTEDAR
ncbi:MAG: hypothetical protein JXR94_05320, partial [Candidatus Hydrogenedentes bacterium]|nr:hypothetical protein [Candidatus Hydrogenedentota bacterium]